MKKKSKAIILSAFFILITISSCSKYSFEKYTETDAVGSIVGEVDETDWNFNDEWTKQEENLFDTKNDLGCKIYHNFNIIAYPNPNLGFFNLGIIADSLTHIEVVLVNKSLKKLKTKQIKFHLSHSDFDLDIHNFIRFDISNFSSGMYRVYYKFIRGNCEFRGHGDILKK